MEGDGLPVAGEGGCFPNREQKPEAECGFPHAARSDEQHVLTRSVAGLFADQSQHFRKGFVACDKGSLEFPRL